MTTRETAMLTCIGLYSGMSEHVLFEMLSMSERIVTLFTSKRVSPECNSMCCLRFLAFVKVLLHSMQANGFSPEWVSICSFRDLA